MNKKKREKLRAASHELIASLGKAKGAVEMVEMQESDCLDNIPENLQGSYRYELMEEVVEYLNSAIEHIEEAISDIQEAAK